MMLAQPKLSITSKTPFAQIKREIERDVYGTRAVSFQPGDVVLDIGAHIGLFSCWLAAKYPEVKIEAYEPVPATYEDLLKNIEPFKNIRAFNLAVDQRPEITIQYTPNVSYCASAHYNCDTGGQTITAKAVTLDSILARHQKIKFLKMDNEGSEWDSILHSSLLDRVEYIGMELHIMPQFQEKYPALKSKLRGHFLNDRLRWHKVEKETAEGV